MNYEIGDQVIILRCIGFGDILKERWVGRVGQIKKIELNGFMNLLFDLEMEENKILRIYFDHNPETKFFRIEDVEIYMKDINFLD